MRFDRYKTTFQKPAMEQYVVSIVSSNGNIVGYAPPYDKDAGFAIVPNVSDAQKYPKSVHAFSRCKGMHVARSMIVGKISAELADIDSKLASKMSKKLRSDLVSDRADVQADFDEVCTYQFQIKKL